MNIPNPFLLALYRHALCLYPERLRLLYQDQLLQTVHDAHADTFGPPYALWLFFFTDLVQSSIKERLLMLRDQVLTRPIVFHALTLGIIFTFLGIFAAAVIQGLLRGGANQPQIQMSDLYSSSITSGIPPGAAIPHNNVDIESSLEPFAIFYDNHGNPVAANGYLNQSIPTPPTGVFQYLRSHPIDKITWQPQPGVRIAAVIRHVSGPNSGFLLTGRSLRFVEEQEDTFRNLVFTAWFLVVGLLATGAAFLNRSQRPRAIPG